MKTQPDILIVMSDQHNARWMGAGGNSVLRTPNFDRLISNGVLFNAAYTPCPICVPARIGFMTGHSASRTGAFHNSNAIHEEQSTFLHSLGAAGYETVLCGRMHLRGVDTRHGFTRRIFGELLPQHHGRRDVMLKNTQGLGESLAGKAASFVGKGYNPVLDYDEHVIQAALDYLDQEHEKPQCLVVGTYGPHHPFIAPTDLFDHYRSVIGLPTTFERETNYRYPNIEKLPELRDRNTVLNVRAAYAGMIEHLDAAIGRLREKWGQFLERKGSDGLFVYTSDHGEHAGEHGIYGKTTFLEPSAGIPLVMEGMGAVNVRAGTVVDSPVSLMDVGATACALAGAELPPGFEGRDLLPLSRGETCSYDRAIHSELCPVKDPKPGIMLRKKHWKLIHHEAPETEDLLFDLDEDPDELRNVAEDYPEVCVEMRDEIQRWWCPEAIRARVAETNKHLVLLGKWGQATLPEEKEVWEIPPFHFEHDSNGLLNVRKE